MSDRYGRRGSILTSGRTKHTSQTGSGSSSRRTSWGDVLSKNGKIESCVILSPLWLKI